MPERVVTFTPGAQVYILRPWDLEWRHIGHVETRYERRMRNRIRLWLYRRRWGMDRTRRWHGRPRGSYKPV